MKRLNILKAMVLFGFFVFAGTEILSLFHWLNFKGVAAYWLLTAVITFFRIKANRPVSRSKFKPEEFSKSELFIFSATGLIIALLGVLAVIAPPNNYDSMTYHMGRIPHWIQNQSISFYATNITRQLWAGPMAEYFILHSQILSGTDCLANLVQWFAMVGCCIGGSLLAGNLGAGRKGQLFAAFLVATIPMGIMQSTTTQNDYVVGFWLLSLFLFLYKLKEDGNIRYAVLSGMSLGLGVLTKGTMLIYGGTLILCFLFSIRKNFNLRSFVIIGSIVFLINAPHFYRNYKLGRHILTPTESSKELKNHEFSPKAVLSLLIRNIGLHLNTPLKAVNKTVEESVYKFHDLLGIETNDPNITLGGEFRIFKGIDEDAVGSFSHLLLFVAAVFMLIVRKERIQRKVWQGLFLYILLSFFAVSVLLKWQIWGSRLHLPLFVIGAPLTATVLEVYGTKNTLIVMTAVLFGLSVPLLTKNPKKRLFSSKKMTVFNANREQLYFITEGNLYSGYKEIADVINSTGCTEIGLSLGEDHWEYPWWILLQAGSGHKKIKHVEVDNLSKKFSRFGQRPCLILKKEPQEKNILEYDGTPYQNIFYQNGFTVYKYLSGQTPFK